MAGPPASTLPSRSEPLPSRIDGPTNRPVSSPPPPPPGITPIAPAQRGMVPPAEAGEPFRPTLTTAAINNARAERQRTVIPPRPKTNGEPRPSHLQRPVDEPPTGGFSATDLSIPVPTPRPGQEAAPPGSRANWPLVNNPEDPADSSPNNPVAYSYGGSRGVDAPTDPGRADGRVTPPWLADDLPQEPPMLRLVEPPPLADRALREGLNPPADPHLETPPLRLVDREQAARNGRAAARTERAAEHRPSPPVEHRPPPMEHRPPPVADEGDGDLLIFAQAKSAWFVGQAEESDLDWSTTADTGWQAAEQAARPAVGAETNAGLPKRVPQANLVPGSPLREERPLRIVRDAASLAENTTGYFRGWRRGQEIGGFAVGGRPGREAAGGWDFSRDHGDRDDDREYEYRSAGLPVLTPFSHAKRPQSAGWGRFASAGRSRARRSRLAKTVGEPVPRAGADSFQVVRRRLGGAPARLSDEPARRARRLAAPGGGRSHHRGVQRPDQAGATARVRRMVSTYSTSEISTCFVDSRLRASQATTGTSLEIAKASRTSCGSWYCIPSKQLIATRYGRRRCSKKSIAAKQSASRRVSTSTTAPIAPRTSSSHMNQNRV